MAAEMTKGTIPYIIGKIPGYNKNIQHTDIGGIAYTNRLYNNLNVVKLRPVGYSISVDLITQNSITGEATDNAASLFGIGNTGGKIAGYKVGDQLSSVANDLNLTSTKGALDVWQRTLAAQQGIDADIGIDINELVILCTNDSTMTEVFSNSYDISSIEKLTNKVSEWKISKVASTVKNAFQAVDSSMGESILGKTDFDGGAFDALVGKALGIQTALPEEWVRSEYNNTLQLMIKLVSPSGDEASIKEYVLKPLLYLILAASPVSHNGITFGYPMLWEVKADGLMDISIAGISALTITRGGAETQFNKDNQPLNIDVRISLSPLVKGYITAIGETVDTASAKGKEIYDGTIAASPGQLVKSFNRPSSTTHRTIRL